MNDTIIMYSTGCPRCNVLTKKLNDKGIDYTKCDSVDEMTKLGIMEVPVLSVNNELMNFSEAISWVNRQG